MVTANSQFRPMAYYNSDGDCIEVHLSDEAYYGKRLDGWVTAYFGEDSGEVVGCMLKGVRQSLLRRYPGLQIDIKGDKVNVALLLRAPAYEAGNELIQKTYKAIIEKAEASHLTADLVEA